MTENINPEDFYIDSPTTAQTPVVPPVEPQVPAPTPAKPNLAKYGSLLVLIVAVAALGLYLSASQFAKPGDAADASQGEEVVPVANTILANKQQEQPKVEEFSDSIAPGFPEFPVISNTTVDTSMRKNSEGKQGFVAEWKTELSVYEMVKVLEIELPQNGWTFVTPFQDSVDIQENFATIQKGDDIANVSVERESEKQVKVTKVLVEFPLK